MARSRNPTLLPTLVFGGALLTLCFALAALWNFIIVADYVRFKNLADQVRTELGVSHWAILIVCSVMLSMVVTGIVLFVISLINQIRTNEAQQNFIDAVTHELKSPLTSLHLHLQTMQRRSLPEEQRRAFTDLMLRDVERLDLLIDHVLAAGRTEQEADEEDPLCAIPLPELLEDVAQAISERHDLPAGAIELRVPPLEVQARQLALQLVFSNLIDNAVKYSVDGVRVEVEASPAPRGRVQVCIRDHGVGIPRRLHKRIFQRFYRVGNELTRTRKGTGLGLFIVAQTLRQLRGRIRVQSNTERGTTFVVTLPKGRPARA